MKSSSGKRERSGSESEFVFFATLGSKGLNVQ